MTDVWYQASGSRTSPKQPDPKEAEAHHPNGPENAQPEATEPSDPKTSEIPEPKSPIIDHGPYISLITHNFNQLHKAFLNEQAESRKLFLELKKSVDARLSQDPPMSSPPHETQQPGPSTTMPPPPPLPKRRVPRKTEPVEHKEDPRRTGFLVS